MTEREHIEIKGGSKLSGTITVGGAKNAALPLIIATLLNPEPCTLHNVPRLEDTHLLFQMLRELGAECSFTDHTAQVSALHLNDREASYELVRAMRASFWVIAPLLARQGRARVTLPGGDKIGTRPVNFLIESLAALGAEMELSHGVVTGSAPQGLKGATIQLPFPSVGATHVVMMAAALAKGTTVLQNAAKEPEIVAVAEFINAMGGDIEGAGGSTIIIRGVSSLRSATCSVIGDRIEAGTYALAALATRSKLTVAGFEPRFLAKFLEILDMMGAIVTTTPHSITVSPSSELKPISISTAPFPGLATDLQPQLMACLMTIPGTSQITETIFEGRFGHVAELCRLGGSINISEQTATIIGGSGLGGAPVEAMDIRAGAAFVIAGLAADNTTKIYEPVHIRRGYDSLEQKLTAVGASIRAVKA